MKNTLEIIKTFIRNNYGESELENPAYDLTALAAEISSPSTLAVRKYVGKISVDSGMVMIADPCYWKNGIDWGSFCKEVGSEATHSFKHEIGIYGKGVMIGNFGGDGVYPVFVEEDENGREIRMIIDF